MALCSLISFALTTDAAPNALDGTNLLALFAPLALPKKTPPANKSPRAVNKLRCRACLRHDEACPPLAPRCRVCQQARAHPADVSARLPWLRAPAAGRGAAAAVHSTHPQPPPASKPSFSPWLMSLAVIAGAGCRGRSSVVAPTAPARTRDSAWTRPPTRRRPTPSSAAVSAPQAVRSLASHPAAATTRPRTLPTLSFCASGAHALSPRTALCVQQLTATDVRPLRACDCREQTRR